MEGESSWEAKTKMKTVMLYTGGLVGLCKTSYNGMLRGRAKVGEIREGIKGAGCA